jgi:hypothetical protein
VNYLKEETELINFFEHASKNLGSRGILIFDSLNGSAVTSESFIPRQKTFIFEGSKIIRNSTYKHDPITKNVTVIFEYQSEHLSAQLTDKWSESHEVKYFSPEDFLIGSREKFTLLTILDPDTLEPILDTSWSALYVFKKVE